MKWLTVLRARSARTFQRSSDFENVRDVRPKLRKNEAAEGVAPVSANQCIGGNPFIVLAHTDRENDFASCHIRNSISLTIRRTRRMICASHQGAAAGAGEKIFSRRSSARNRRNASRCADGGAVPTQE